ncbi:hypothetical protein [Niveibacterium sp. SC-1]|uniref:hypothetical protein n=1 Tax=Niveibacterium sp. SC-1 TaxID=3135646 RepID=UPI00311EAD10
MRAARTKRKAGLWDAPPAGPAGALERAGMELGRHWALDPGTRAGNYGWNILEEDIARVALLFKPLGPHDDGELLAGCLEEALGYAPRHAIAEAIFGAAEPPALLIYGFFKGVAQVNEAIDGAAGEAALVAELGVQLTPKKARKKAAAALAERLEHAHGSELATVAAARNVIVTRELKQAAKARRQAG